MSGYIMTNPTAGEWLDQACRRHGITGAARMEFEYAVEKAWDEGKESEREYCSTYTDWYDERGHDVVPPEQPDNPYTPEAQ